MTRCDDLLAVDFSTEAIVQAKTRRLWPTHVRFEEWDLYGDRIDGFFDLIVVVGVLDYVNGPIQMKRMRSKLIDSLAPGGLLMIGNSKNNEVIDNAWWARALVRGAKWINRFIAMDGRLTVVSQVEQDRHLDTLFRKHL